MCSKINTSIYKMFTSLKPLFYYYCLFENSYLIKQEKKEGKKKRWTKKSHNIALILRFGFDRCPVREDFRLLSGTYLDWVRVRMCVLDWDNRMVMIVGDDLPVWVLSEDKRDHRLNDVWILNLRLGPILFISKLFWIFRKILRLCNFRWAQQLDWIECSHWTILMVQLITLRITQWKKRNE